jgi:basic membrane protein A
MVIYLTIVKLNYFILGSCVTVILVISVSIIYRMETLENQLTQTYFPSATAQAARTMENDTGGSGKGITIALLTDALFSDAGCGAFGFNAAQALKSKYGHEVDFKDNVPISDIETTLREYAADGYDMIIAQGFVWGDPAVKVGKDYPNTKFVVFTGLANSTNVASIFPRQQEGTYLLGALAAMMSKTGIIGFVGGERYPNLINIYEGYKQGAKAIDNNIKVLDTYLNDWDSPEKGYQGAMSQINKGADLLLQIADTSGHGVIQAAKEKDVYVFDAVSDQNILAPNTVLTSFVLDVSKAFDHAIKMVQMGNFTGQIFKPGLEAGKNASGDSIVYIAPFHRLENKISENIKSKLDLLERDVLEGRIVVYEKYPGASNLTTIS